MKPQGQQHQNSATSHAMTPEAQRIAIAEACGKISCWHKKEVVRTRLGSDERFPNYPWESPNDPTTYKCVDCGRIRGALIDDKSLMYFLNNTPNYLSDLNAMHEAEKVLTPGQHYTFRRALWQVTDCKSPSSFPWTLGEVNGEEHNRRYCSATATQRAEAFLRTIGKWADGVQGSVERAGKADVETRKSLTNP